MHSATLRLVLMLANTSPAWHAAELAGGPVDARAAPAAAWAGGAVDVRATPALAGGAGQQRWIRVSAGDFDVCAIDGGGRIWCWGTGVGGPGQAPIAADVTEFTEIAVGLRDPCDRRSPAACPGRGAHACALARGGVAWCWGENRHGQLGDGTTTNRPAPTRVRTAQRFQSIRAGRGITCGMAGSSAYCWGSNETGALGTGAPDTLPHTIPHAVAHDARTIEAAADYVCALSRTGFAYCWGEDYHGRLGSDAVAARLAATPVPVNGVTRFATLSARGNHACGLTDRGTLHCWGSNVDGQLGIDPAAVSATRDLVEPAAPPFALVTAGSGSHTCAVATDSSLWCWGRNADGELGLAPGGSAPGPRITCYASPCVPAPTRAATRLRFQSLSAGNAFTCGITLRAQLLCWGRVPWGGPSNAAAVPPPQRFSRAAVRFDNASHS